MKLAMRSIMVGTALTLGVMAAPRAQVSIGISTPHVSIGINVPTYPTMAVIPGYPVYYAPQVDANYFFYDGLYWVYADDNWYSSYWYNGPWTLVAPVYVPVYVLRVPVRYYRAVPVYFRSWHPEAPPRWGERWGHDWEQRRGGWDRWDRHAAPRPAPLPTYQRQFAGERYPRRDQQVVLHDQNYRYQPRDHLVREQVEKERLLRSPATQARSTPPGQQRHDEARAAAPAPAPQMNTHAPARSGGPPREIGGAPQDRKDAQRDAQRGDAQREPKRDTPRDAQRDAQREPPGPARRESQPPRSAPPQQHQAQRSTPEPQPKVQHANRPQPQAQGRDAVQPREPRPDARAAARADAPHNTPSQSGKSQGQGQERGHGGASGNGKGGQERAKGGDDHGKK